MNNTNKLISGDNKGLASYMVERDMNGKVSEHEEQKTREGAKRGSEYCAL